VHLHCVHQEARRRLPIGAHGKEGSAVPVHQRAVPRPANRYVRRKRSRRRRSRGAPTLDFVEQGCKTFAEPVARPLIRPGDESVERHGHVEKGCGHGVSFPPLRAAERTQQAEVSSEGRSIVLPIQTGRRPTTNRWHRRDHRVSGQAGLHARPHRCWSNPGSRQ
jgi:hypothetical protein